MYSGTELDRRGHSTAVFAAGVAYVGARMANSQTQIALAHRMGSHGAAILVPGKLCKGRGSLH